MKNRTLTLATLFLALGFLAALSQIAQAVAPAPDGGYPGGNTAEGQGALLHLNTGVAFYNTAVGFWSLQSDVQGNFNTALGAAALLANTADQNTATGTGALASNTIGAFNDAHGAFALFSNIDGAQNTATGADALFSNTSGGSNVAVGALALFHNTTGFSNSALGVGALFSNIDGGQNTAVGSSALSQNVTGVQNTAIGAEALLANIASDNTAVGYAALNTNGIGISDTATGSEALSNNSTGNFNSADGSQALQANTTGSANTAVGASALQHSQSGNSNTAIGLGALSNNISGTNNIALGANAGSNVVTASDTICIGFAGVDVSDGCYIGHVFEEPLDPDNLAMAIDVHGKVGTLPSSRRFKDDIKPMDKTSEAILALKPVTFHYKNDGKHRPQFGLIAEEVAEVDRSLVALDKEGKPFSVRYDKVNAMLLNEFLKEHKKVKVQETTIDQQQVAIAALQSWAAQQQKGIDVLSLRLKEQAAQIRKVGTQIETSRSESQMAVNNL
jgi:hypothetical protein